MTSCIAICKAADKGGPPTPVLSAAFGVIAGRHGGTAMSVTDSPTAATDVGTCTAAAPAKAVPPTAPGAGSLLLIGHSYGAFVCARAVRNCKEGLIRGVVLLDPLCFLLHFACVNIRSPPPRLPDCARGDLVPAPPPRARGIFVFFADVCAQ